MTQTNDTPFDVGYSNRTFIGVHIQPFGMYQLVGWSHENETWDLYLHSFYGQGSDGGTIHMYYCTATTLEMLGLNPLKMQNIGYTYYKNQNFGVPAYV